MNTSYEENIARTLTKIHEQPDLEISRNIDDLRIAIFSDHHRGQLDGADDFRRCKPAYHAALGYYLEAGYTLLLLGDVEELWECRPGNVLKKYADTIQIEQQFFDDGRLFRFYGNHDDHWAKSGAFSKAMRQYFHFYDEFQVYESLRLNVQDGNESLGEILFVHGHQGETMSDRFSWLSRWFVRNIWRNIQRVTKIPSTTPSKDFQLRKKHELAQYEWSRVQSGLLLIAGHTHHPVFSSQSHESLLQQQIEELKGQKESASSPEESEQIQNSINNLSAELQWVLAKSSGVQMVLPEESKPSYFNSGCCSFGDGDITGLEICDREIRLIRWPDDDKNPKRKILRNAELAAVLNACV